MLNEALKKTNEELEENANNCSIRPPNFSISTHDEGSRKNSNVTKNRRKRTVSVVAEVEEPPFSPSECDIKRILSDSSLVLTPSLLKKDYAKDNLKSTPYSTSPAAFLLRGPIKGIYIYRDIF